MNFRTVGIALQAVGGIIACGGVGSFSVGLLISIRGNFGLLVHLATVLGFLCMGLGAALIWLGRRCREEHDPHPNLTAARWRRVQAGRPASSRAGHKGHVRQ